MEFIDAQVEGKKSYKKKQWRPPSKKKQVKQVSVPLLSFNNIYPRARFAKDQPKISVCLHFFQKTTTGLAWGKISANYGMGG
jgi:hypothetical protein